MPVELLLIDRHTGQPIIDQRIDDAALPPPPRRVTQSRPLHRSHSDPETRDELNYWTVIHADNRNGWAALEAIAPLMELRGEECEVRTLALPGHVRSESAIGSWCRQNEILGPDDGSDLDPEHIVVLGDLPDVSLLAQYEFAERAYTGRLCFTHARGGPDLDAYRRYCDKVVSAESHEPASAARSLFYCSRGDPVSEQAYSSVVRRSWKSSQKSGHSRDFARRFTNWSQLTDHEYGLEEPSVLFSMCHGAYEANASRQRAHQGGLALQEEVGGDIQFLFADDFEGQGFLRDGFWFMMTCYSAATPAESVYARWLQKLTAMVPPSELERATASLAQGDPFVARLPQVVLSDPDGPLGVLGHADMTWSMGYNDHRLDGDTGSVQTVVGAAYSAYAQVVNSVVRGARFGPATRELLEFSASDSGVANAGASAQTLRALHYMRYLDRRCYILLGDPAARLPVAV